MARRPKGGNRNFLLNAGSPICIADDERNRGPKRSDNSEEVNGRTLLLFVGTVTLMLVLVTKLALGL